MAASQVKNIKKVESTSASLKRIAFINVGGIGDNLLFYPVVQAIKQQCPQITADFILEGRSQAAMSLMPDVDCCIPVQVQGKPKWALFFRLLSILRTGQYDAVISCGSSPFIAFLLRLSGIPNRIGFDNGGALGLGRYCLTSPASLDTTGYAAKMYYALAQAFFKGMGISPLNPPLSLPKSIVPSDEQVAILQERLASIGIESSTQSAQSTQSKKNMQCGKPLILVHPGVSRVSIEKGLVKRWHPSRWSVLIQKMSETGKVLLIGGPDDVGEIAAIRQQLPENNANIVVGDGLTRSLDDLAALLTQVDCFVCADSAPMHVAVGVNTPLVALFGEMDPARLLPDEHQFAWFREESGVVRQHQGYLEIAVDDVYNGVEQVLMGPVI